MHQHPKRMSIVFKNTALKVEMERPWMFDRDRPRWAKQFRNTSRTTWKLQLQCPHKHVIL